MVFEKFTIENDKVQNKHSFFCSRWCMRRQLLFHFSKPQPKKENLKNIAFLCRWVKKVDS